MNDLDFAREIVKLQNEIRALRTIQIGGIWSTYTLAWTAATTNPAIGDGILEGRYTLIGNTVHVNIYMYAGSTTTFGTGVWSFSLPFTAANISGHYGGTLIMRDSGIRSYIRIADITPTAAVVTNFIEDQTNSYTIDASTPFAWGKDDYLRLNLVFERG